MDLIVLQDSLLHAELLQVQEHLQPQMYNLSHLRLFQQHDQQASYMPYVLFLLCLKYQSYHLIHYSIP